MCNVESISNHPGFFDYAAVGRELRREAELIKSAGYELVVDRHGIEREVSALILARVAAGHSNLAMITEFHDVIPAIIDEWLESRS